MRLPCFKNGAYLRSTHSTQQQRSKQDTETVQSCRAKTNFQQGIRKTPPHCLTGSSTRKPWLASESYRASSLKCASCPGSVLLQISGVVCIREAFVPVLLETHLTVVPCSPGGGFTIAAPAVHPPAPPLCGQWSRTHHVSTSELA
jgi:hypothetical protein